MGLDPDDVEEHDEVLTHDFGDGPVAAHRHINRTDQNPVGTRGGWVDDTAIVDPTAMIDADAEVLGSAEIGAHVIIEKKVRIDNRATVGPRSVIHKLSVISADVEIGMACEITSRSFVASGAILGDGVKFQLTDGNVLVLPNVTIPDFSVVSGTGVVTPPSPTSPARSRGLGR